MTNEHNNGIFDDTPDETALFADDGAVSEDAAEGGQADAGTDGDTGSDDIFADDPIPGEPHHIKKARKRKRNLIIWLCVAALIVGCALGLWLYISDLRSNPGQAFEPSPTPSATPVVTPDPSAEVTPEPTIDPYDAMWEQADKTLMKDIVNVLVIGVDYAEERETWNGKHAYHADVMLLLAIDFNNNTVDMISIPRDTYAKIPGVEGKYKINASIDCGGGWPTTGGFEKCMAAAEWMLGGYPVDYYVAVSMPVVKELVNAVGGVDYDMDIEFEISDRHYYKGMQHMDGQAVLDYIRVRKDESIVVSSGQTGDRNRINRQKRILLALFNKMKNNNMILSIPSIIQAFSGRLYTNLTNEQFMALAVFAYDLPSDSIEMHSMGGSNYNVFNWNFCLTDQKARVALIQEVYGVKVSQYTQYSKDYVLSEWGDMLWAVYDDVSWLARNAIITAYEADYLAITTTPEPTETPVLTPDPAVTPTPDAGTTPNAENTPASIVSPAAACAATPTPTPMPVPTPYGPPAGIQYTGAFSAAQHAKYQQLLSVYEQLDDVTVVGKERMDLCATYKTLIIALAKTVSFTDKIVWDVVLEYEIVVDFR